MRLFLVALLIAISYAQTEITVSGCGDEATFTITSGYYVNSAQGVACEPAQPTSSYYGLKMHCEEIATAMGKTFNSAQLDDDTTIYGCFENGSGELQKNAANYDNYNSSFAGKAVCKSNVWFSYTTPANISNIAGLALEFKDMSPAHYEPETMLWEIAGADDVSTPWEQENLETDYNYRFVVYPYHSYTLKTLTGKVRLVCIQTEFIPTAQTFKYVVEDYETKFCGVNGDQGTESLQKKECKDAANAMGLTFNGTVYRVGSRALDPYCAINAYTGVVTYNDVGCNAGSACDYSYDRFRLCKSHEAGDYCGQTECWCGDSCKERSLDCKSSSTSCSDYEVAAETCHPTLVASGMKCNAEATGWPTNNVNLLSPRTLQDCVNEFASAGSGTYFSVRGFPTNWGSNHVYCMKHDSCTENERVADSEWKIYQVSDCATFSCGDGICEAGETKETCPTDCESCRDWCNSSTKPWEDKCEWNHCYSCEECHNPVCECKDAWSEGCDTEQYGCTNCDGDSWGSWCEVKDPNCRTAVYGNDRISEGWAYCTPPPV